MKYEKDGRETVNDHSDDIAQHITPERVRGFQMVYVGLAGSVMVFMVMLLFFFGMGSDMDRDEASPAAMDALSIVVIVITTTCLVAGQGLYLASFNSKRVARSLAEPMRDGDRVIDDPIEKSIRILQRAMITRAAIFDVPAFFGVVVCLVGMMQGVAFNHPIYLLNALPAVAQLVFLGVTFPTHEKIGRLVRGRELKVQG
jgi:hypothetical protein